MNQFRIFTLMLSVLPFFVSCGDNSNTQEREKHTKDELVDVPAGYFLTRGNLHKVNYAIGYLNFFVWPDGQIDSSLRILLSDEKLSCAQIDSINYRKQNLVAIRVPAKKGTYHPSFKSKNVSLIYWTKPSRNTSFVPFTDTQEDILIQISKHDTNNIALIINADSRDVLEGYYTYGKYIIEDCRPEGIRAL